MSREYLYDALGGFQRIFWHFFYLIYKIFASIKHYFPFSYSRPTDPPGVPYIEGYAPGEVIRRGQHVQLACRSRGGNPPAQLIWYKNGNQARMAYRTTDRFSENIYAFVAEASDNKARLRCEANNKMATKILKAEIILNVLCK